LAAALLAAIFPSVYKATPAPTAAEDTLLTPAELADFLKLKSVWGVYNLIRENSAPPCVRIGRRGLRFRKSSVLRWLAEKER